MPRETIYAKSHPLIKSKKKQQRGFCVKHKYQPKSKFYSTSISKTKIS
ncbi:hypothetical protein THERMOT_1456 [Bathymodiolus thermophilus thioautotrophic gill symbiont]|nr:hypothetical protein THERMOT_1456 [Bathymodiolus thermophilus thioautotrophic gill symbiont]